MSATPLPRRGFWSEVGFALLLSLAVAALFPLGRAMLGSADALRLLLLACTFAYALWTLHAASLRVGRLVALAALLLLALGLLMLQPALWLWLFSLLGALWLLRCLYRHDSLLACSADAGLSLLALAAGLASLQHNHSLWLALWCFFLLQAMHHWIPAGWGARAPQVDPGLPGVDAFTQAQRAGEAAFARMLRRR